MPEKDKRKPSIWDKISSLFLGVVLTLILCYFFWPQLNNLYNKYISNNKATNLTVTETAGTTVIEQPKVPYTVSVKLESSVMDEAQREKKLIIYSRKNKTIYEKTKNGLFNWDVFSQTKLFIFHGVGTYTVDFASFDKNSISINDNDKTIEIHIPEPVLSVEYLPEETEFYDGQNGMLRFGEMQLTPEMMIEVEKLGKEQLKDEFNNDSDSLLTAEKYAILSVKDIFQPLINQQVDAAVKSANDVYAKPAYYTVNVVIDPES